MKKPDIQELISLSKQAADAILSIYRQSSFVVNLKADKSLLTQADLESHAIICEGLKKICPDIPIISEESFEQYPYEIRKNWPSFFLVDPLDGTKEFVNRNDEFTINIALIHHGKPIMGVVHAPALNIIYYAEHHHGAYKIMQDKPIKLSTQLSNNSKHLTVAISRSHSCEKTENFLEHLKTQGKQVMTCAAGSALKFGLIAEGMADIYPRFTPTMEWDTAAGHVLINEMGKSLSLIETNQSLHYNKIDLKNPGFIVHSPHFSTGKNELTL